ncbi:MAG: hypothetical protein A2Z72_03470 [Omnitrophica bacterium RBG_13_46_9]|nr:MAG: hypothetical protein A2Z72_03470 [Omnitrophica bacterium RBG_13_46_9]
MIYLLSRLIFKFILLLFFGFEVKGRENIPKKGPFIMVSNHTSYVDPAVVGVACNTVPLVFMAKKEIFNVPILGPWVKAVGCIPVGRGSREFKPLKEALQRLKCGESLCIFPEGTRSPDGNLQKAQPGIGLIAAKSGAPVVPAYVSGTNKAMPKGKKYITPCKITAKIGKIVDLGECLRAPQKRHTYDSIGERVMCSISELKSDA